MARLWRPGEVELGDRFERDGLIYRVVGLINDPVAVLEPADGRDGEDREYHVISSPLFAEFEKVRLLAPGETVHVA